MTLPLYPVDDPDLQFNFDKIAAAVGEAPILHSTDSAGGDLTGTYPNPTIGTGRVTVAKTAVGIFLELQTTGTSRKVSFGSNTVVFTAADTSAQLTVPHGLGVTPLCVMATPRATANARLTIQETASPDSTNFYVKGFQTQGTSISLSQSFYWLAVG